MEETQRDISHLWAWLDVASQLDDNTTLAGDDLHDDPWVSQGEPSMASIAQYDNQSLGATPWAFECYETGLPAVDSQPSSTGMLLTPESCANITTNDQDLFSQYLTCDTFPSGTSFSESPAEPIETPPAWPLIEFGHVQPTGIPSPPYAGPPVPLTFDMPIPLLTSPLLESHTPEDWLPLYDTQWPDLRQPYLVSLDFNSPAIHSVSSDSPLAPEVSTQRFQPEIETPSPGPTQQPFGYISPSSRPRPRQRNLDPQVHPPRRLAKFQRRIDLPEKCEVCHKGHQFKALKDRHIRVHHPEYAEENNLLTPRPVCPECGRDYARSDHLYRHGVGKHGWPPRKKKS